MISVCGHADRRRDEEVRAEMRARQSVSYSSGIDGACFLSNMTTTDGDPSHYLEDPDLFADSLPQPFRRINRILNSIVDAALDTAEYNESKLIHNVNQRRAPQYDSANIIAEIDNVVTIAASPDGKFVYVSNSNGCLYCVGASRLDIVAQWKPEDAAAIGGGANHEPAVLTSLIAAGFADHVYLIAATDSSGIVKLFLHIINVIVLAQTLSDLDDASHKSLVISVEVSSCAGFVGLVAQNVSDPALHTESSPAPSGDMFLEICRLPKEAWLKEVEPLQQVLEQSATLSEDEDSSSTSVPVIKFTPLSVVLKLRPPARPTGMIWSSAYDALKSVEASIPDHVIGTGLSHLVSKQHLELRVRAFECFHRQHASLLHSSSVDALIPSPTTPRPTFHFLTPCRQIPQQPDISSVGGANSTTVVAVWWTGYSHVLHYSLIRPAKDVEANVADIVWPMSNTIVATATSHCSTLMAVALANSDIVVWNRDVGLCVRTARINDCGSPTSLHFISSSAAAEASICPSSCILSLIVGTSTGHVFTLACTPRSTAPAKSVYIDVEDESEIPERIHPVPGMPELMVICCNDGRVFICDIERCLLLCELVKPTVDMSTLGQALQPSSLTSADDGRSIYAVVSLPADQLAEPDEDLDKVDDSCSRSGECHPYKTLLLVFRIIYYPTFDGFTFPSESCNFGLVDVSQPMLDNQVSTAWRARSAERAERRVRLEKRWFELNQNSTMQAEA